MLTRVRHETFYLFVSVMVRQFARVVRRPGSCSSVRQVQLQTAQALWWAPVEGMGAACLCRPSVHKASLCSTRWLVILFYNKI